MDGKAGAEVVKMFQKSAIGVSNQPSTFSVVHLVYTMCKSVLQYVFCFCNKL
jgi:hypothetical protein